MRGGAWDCLRPDALAGLQPAGARRLDDAAGRIDGLRYSHFGGVQQDGVGRAAPWGPSARPASRASRVRSASIIASSGAVVALGRGLQPAPARRAPPGAASTQSLAGASGAITVPMSRPSSTAPPGWSGEGALQVVERRAHARDAPPPGWPPRPPARVCSAGSSSGRGVERPRRRRRRRRVARIAARRQHRMPDAAVEQAGVQVRQAVVGRPASPPACPCPRRRPRRRRSRSPCVAR